MNRPAIHYHWRFNPQAVSLFSYDFLSPTACYLERLREFPNKRPLQTTDKPFIDNSLSPHNVCLVTRWLNYSSNSQVSPAVTNDFLFRVLHPKPRFSFDLSFQAAYDWQIMVSWQQQTAENERKIAAAQQKCSSRNSLWNISCPPSIFYMWLVFLGALAFYFHGAPKKCVSANKRFIGKDVGTV